MSSSEPNDFGVLAWLDERVSELHRNIPHALREFDAEAIHDARVATRRLRAATTLLAPVLSGEPRRRLEKTLRKIRRRLGPLRDLDVMIERLDRLASHRAHGAAAAWLRDMLHRERDHERRKARGRSTPGQLLAKLGAWWAVREEIVEAREAVDSLLVQSLHLQLDAFAEQAGAIDARDGPRRDPHELRIAGKLLRYTLELARAGGHKLPASILGAFRKMQESLGDWHDQVVLIECALSTAVDESVAYHDPEMLDRILRLARSAGTGASRDLAEFSKLWKARGEATAVAIRERFPLSRALTESKTDPDPPGSGDTPAPAAPPPDVASAG